ncbi:TetR/AcrR family transcriptional regulator [Actinacidiphila rubida]|uniref:Transcriptional regulator, TetR family n=1 Tax=Actinacidiphila rubida TaxID=310780 RepID=A0A1H8J2F8_9ACTN|nr:TetR/AcrR family transcriptional regulator [Actinacidiphila rubida]SEN74397.1 transcriptional regulator, TetR family [Actinacidiphila rubida]
MTTSSRAIRADAARNVSALLAAATDVFKELGADAPLDEIPRRAGVGRATMYRRFPTREHLFVAILRSQVDTLVEAAETRMAAPDPWQALLEWLSAYEEVGAQYRGMNARISAAVLEDSSPIGELCTPMKTAFDVLFRRAQELAGVRRDVSSADVLAIVSALPRDPDTGRARTTHLTVVLDGLRSTAKTAVPTA